MTSTIPETMKRLVLVKQHRDLNQVELRVETAPVPTPGPGEVLVRMSAAPVNPSDYEKWRRVEKKGDTNAVEEKKEEVLSEPVPLGNEGSGVVVANGGGLMGWSKVGKPVAVANVRDGTYQEYVCVPAHMAISLGNDIPVEDACSMFVNPFTVVGMAHTAREKGSPCFIHTAGASVLGQMLNRASKDLDVTPVNVVRKEAQVELLKSLGAKYIVNTSDDNWRAELQQLIKDLKITVCFDAIAGPMTGQLLSMLPPHGHLFNYGVLSGEPIQNIEPMDIIYREKHLHGFYLRTWLRSGGMLNTAWRFYNVSNMVLANLHPGKWAASEFKDCTLEAMPREFLEIFNTLGFTGSKLRIRF
eukprot:GEMP01034278.1.p1 GENE.GEMP01034278.1~~GEMP01034278.1.p1  ORF type:complete len:357 (+),score=104.23 GEMP01034278.1:168-1238(+)